MLTGRHLTLRADGNSVDRAAFGGPLIYGHGEENPKENLYYYQTTQTNEVFKALDSGQVQQRCSHAALGEAAVQIQGAGGKFPGIAVGQLTSDQQQLVEATLGVLLAPYRPEDAAEVMEIVKADGGVGKLHMAFYQSGDLNKDKVWDICASKARRSSGISAVRRTRTPISTLRPSLDASAGGNAQPALIPLQVGGFMCPRRNKLMKTFALTLISIVLLSSDAAFAQQPAAPTKTKEFQAGKPLGSVNEAGEFMPMTSNVKVYGSFRFAESVTTMPHVTSSW